MLSRRGVLKATLAGSLATAGLTACTPAPPVQTTPAATPSTPAPASGGVDARPVSGLAKGGLLRLPITSLPTDWNPWASGYTADAGDVRGPLSAPAFLLDASGTARPNPDVLVSATASGTPTVATLTLNPLAVWGDGTPVTAADWIATHAAIGAGPGRLAAATAPGWELVAQVKQGASDREVLVTYTRAVLNWTRPLIAGCLRAASVADAATFNQGWGAYRPEWFAGPYTLAFVDERRGLLTLAPNPKWWGAAPPLDEIFFRVVPTDSLAVSVAAGEFDRYSPGTDADQLALARTAPGTSVRSAPGTSGRRLTFASKGPLADAALRRALVLGLDRAALARASTAKLGVTPVVWSNDLLLPQQAGYVDAAATTGLGHDAAKAGQWLTDNGYPLTDGVRRGPAGQVLLTFTVPDGDERAAAEASEVKAQLATLGLTVSTVATGGDIGAEDVVIPEFPLSGTASRFPDIAAAVGALGAVDAATDAENRLTLAATAAAILWAEAPTLPLYAVPDIVVVKTTLANLGASGYASTDWATVGFTG